MNYDIEAIARGQHEVNTKELSPIESIQGLFIMWRWRSTDE